MKSITRSCSRNLTYKGFFVQLTKFPLKVCWAEFHLAAVGLLVFEFRIKFITRILQFSIIFKLHIQAQFFNPCAALIIEV